MAQRAEGAGLRVIKGEGADSGHGIPNPRPQLIGAVGTAFDGLGGELHLLVPPDGPDAHPIPLQALEHRLDLFNGVHLGIVDVGDDVTLAQTAVLGGRAASRLAGDLRQPYHQYAVGEHLDAHRPTQRHHHPLPGPQSRRGPGFFAAGSNRSGPAGDTQHQQPGQQVHCRRPNRLEKLAGPGHKVLVLIHCTTPF